MYRIFYINDLVRFLGDAPIKNCPLKAEARRNRAVDINSVPPSQVAIQRHPPSGGACQLILPLPQRFCKRLLRSALFDSGSTYQTDFDTQYGFSFDSCRHLPCK